MIIPHWEQWKGRIPTIQKHYFAGHNSPRSFPSILLMMVTSFRTPEVSIIQLNVTFNVILLDSVQLCTRKTGTTHFRNITLSKYFIVHINYFTLHDVHWLLVFQNIFAARHFASLSEPLAMLAVSQLCDIVPNQFQQHSSLQEHISKT